MDMELICVHSCVNWSNSSIYFNGYHFLPLHTRHSNPSYIFIHVLHLSFVFRVVSQNKRPDLQLTSQLVDHYSVTTPFPSQE